MQKYNAHGFTLDGIRWDSKKEFARWNELKLLEKAGEIKNLRRQVKYELLPAQYEGKKCLHKSVNYYADFVYEERGETVTEDVKGMITDVYKLKKKLMYFIHKIKIKES